MDTILGVCFFRFRLCTYSVFPRNIVCRLLKVFFHSVMNRSLILISSALLDGSVKVIAVTRTEQLLCIIYLSNFAYGKHFVFARSFHSK